MISAVLDTNIVISAQLNTKGPPAVILELAFSRYFRCFVSEILLQEYEEVLSRPPIGIDLREAWRLIRAIRKIAILVVPRKRLKVALDPDDDLVVECALEARADYLVTGNIRHFPQRFQDIRIVPPRQFLTILASHSN